MKIKLREIDYDNIDCNHPLIIIGLLMIGFIFTFDIMAFIYWVLPNDLIRGNILGLIIGLLIFFKID